MKNNGQLKEPKRPKSPRERFRIMAVIMLVCGIIYIPYTLMNTELLPYSKSFMYTTYIVYVVVTIMCFILGFKPQPKPRKPEPKKRAKPKNHVR